MQKIFDAVEFGYNKIVIERPLRYSYLIPEDDVHPCAGVFVKDEKLVNNDESFNVFRIPIGGSVFNDTRNVNIYFQVEVENEIYTEELNINELQANMPCLTKESVLLENSNGDILDSVFTYCLHRSI